jgi:NitT/TauT family transport system permease protein
MSAVFPSLPGTPAQLDAHASTAQAAFHPAAGEPPVRAEVEFELAPYTAAPVERALPWTRRLADHALLRRAAILAVLALLWELLARWTDNELLLPTFAATARAFAEGLQSGELLEKASISLSLLLQGYVLGIAAAFALTALAATTRLGRDLLSTLTSMFNPLPAIALLPLALLWFGLGRQSLLFVLVHAVLWPLALAAHAGFQNVPDVLRMAGRNYGLTGLRLVLYILIPSALPAILSGLRIAWAFAWRTLIAAELVFGATSGQGGLGWYVFQNRNELYTDRVFAGLACVIVIGLVIENLVFATLERVTVRRWGVQR